MKASHSALVTRLRASLTGPTSARCAGFSLSKWKLSSVCPTVWMPSFSVTHSSPVRVASREAPRRVIGRRDRVLRERMQDVGQHQFLMLLLVVEADFDQRRESWQACPRRRLEELHHGGVDMAAIGGDFVGARAGQMAALVAGMPRAGADVIGIEQEGVVGMKGLVAVECSPSRNCSKNQVVWARCHFAGLASGIDWISWSSGDRGAARRSVSSRTVRNASTRSWARLPEPENSDGQGAADAAAADAGFVTGISGRGKERCSGDLGSRDSLS